VSRETSSALARANMSMQEAVDAMQQGGSGAEQAQQALDALNRLALSLLNSSQQMQGSESGTSGQQSQELADMAQQQASLNGQSSALSPMDLSQRAMQRQLDRMAGTQAEMARRLGEMNSGGSEELGAEIDALAREAEELARQLRSGRLP